MKRCTQCATVYQVKLERCPTCFSAPESLAGFEVYAPALAHTNDGFKPEYFSDLADAEAESFWFRARNELLLWAVSKYAPAMESFLEIGCGTGFVLSAIAKKFPHVSLHGSEIFIEGLHFSRQRLPHAHLMQMDVRHIPFVDEFDVVGAFDVLEHIEEDTEALQEIYTALRSGGIFIATVPQHMWLWSATDEHACHVRRYEAKDMHTKLASAGFSILHSSSFVSLLLPAMYAARWKKQAQHLENGGIDELRLPSLLNNTFFHIMRLEIVLIKCGIRFPFGGSRLIIAQKQ